MGYELSTDDMEALLLGGAFFGSGGGGTVQSARHLCAHFKPGRYYPTDRVEVVGVAEATEGEAVMVAYMGAPEAINSVAYPIGPVEAARAVQQRLVSQGRTLAYIAPPESGALGFVVAVLVAAKLGLKVIDGDGAGRAVPSLPMLTYAAAGVSPRPTFLVSQGELRVELDVTPRYGEDGGLQHQQDVSVIVEQMTRPIVAAPQFGQFGGLALWVMPPTLLDKALPIRGTVARALTLGRALQAGQITATDAMIEFLAERFHIQAVPIMPPGRLMAVQTDTSGGFDTGKVVLQSNGQTVTVLFENESLLAWDSAKPHPIAMAPDSIAYFLEGKGQAVYTNGDLIQSNGTLDPSVMNRRASLLAWRAEAPLTEPGGLILDSFRDALKDLGYLGPYVPVDALAAA
ncbi:DUF917 domain-containing protein [Pararhodospirillum photometricum]|nr:DUF917 family protein [Pararhodospirillum photometricum]